MSEGYNKGRPGYGRPRRRPSTTFGGDSPAVELFGELPDETRGGYGGDGCASPSSSEGSSSSSSSDAGSTDTGC